MPVIINASSNSSTLEKPVQGFYPIYNEGEGKLDYTSQRKIINLKEGDVIIIGLFTMHQNAYNISTSNAINYYINSNIPTSNLPDHVKFINSQNNNDTVFSTDNGANLYIQIKIGVWQITRDFNSTEFLMAQSPSSGNNVKWSLVILRNPNYSDIETLQCLNNLSYKNGNSYINFWNDFNQQSKVDLLIAGGWGNSSEDYTWEDKIKGFRSLNSITIFKATYSGTTYIVSMYIGIRMGSPNTNGITIDVESLHEENNNFFEVYSLMSKCGFITFTVE